MNPSVSFVCEPGRLEAQAVVLAASLRAQHGDLELIAAVPRALPAATADALTNLGVCLQSINNPVACDYPIGNKVAALGAGDPRGLRLFLDTDTLCLRPLDWRVLGTHGFAAKSADIATFGDASTWQRLYARFGLQPPAAVMTASVSEVPMHPYFNAGMMATSHAEELATEWGRICRAIDAMDDINPRRPWLDQIALPIAVARLGLAFRILGEAWNYPAHMKPLHEAAAIVHYHQSAVVAREPAMAQRVGELLARYPKVAAVVRSDVSWAPVLAVINAQQRQRRRRRSLFHAARMGRGASICPGGDVIVSGIPVSGADAVCALLAARDHTVVVDDPPILSDWLRYSPDPWTVPILHADLRRRVVTGDRIENRVHRRGGMRAASDEHPPRHGNARRSAEGVIVATKSTLPCMARLEGLLRLMPDARILVCVRHPLDTLGAWKDAGGYLAAGDCADVPVGGLADPFLPAQMRRALESLAGMPDAAVRRASWWRLLAQDIVRWRTRLVIVRYEDLVAHPEATLKRALGPLWGAAAKTADLARLPVDARGDRTSLDAADYAAVAQSCADVAEALDYDVADASR